MRVPSSPSPSHLLQLLLPLALLPWTLALPSLDKRVADSYWQTQEYSGPNFFKCARLASPTRFR